MRREFKGMAVLRFRSMIKRSQSLRKQIFAVRRSRVVSATNPHVGVWFKTHYLGS
jgi:hypothetical protein